MNNAWNAGNKMESNESLIKNSTQTQTDYCWIKTANLDTVTEIQLEDESLKKDLQEYLDISREEKSDERKTLQIEFSGEKERECKIGYLIEMPVWKSSYRIIFDGRDPQPFLQAWAFAENTTGENWDNVEVSFVAGNPLSFILDMYTPNYRKRNEVPMPGLKQFEADWDFAPLLSKDRATSLVAKFLNLPQDARYRQFLLHEFGHLRKKNIELSLLEALLGLLDSFFQQNPADDFPRKADPWGNFSGTVVGRKIDDRLSIFWGDFFLPV